jgi:hypothetical protein
MQERDGAHDAVAHRGDRNQRYEDAERFEPERSREETAGADFRRAK